MFHALTIFRRDSRSYEEPMLAAQSEPPESMNAVDIQYGHLSKAIDDARLSHHLQLAVVTGLAPLNVVLYSGHGSFHNSRDSITHRFVLPFHQYIDCTWGEVLGKLVADSVVFRVSREVPRDG